MALTKTEKLIRYLQDGRERTPDQIARKTGLVNVSSTVDRLRQEGYVIYNNRKGTTGNKYTAYRMA